MIIFYNLPERLDLKHKELSDVRVVSLTKKEFLAKIHKVFKVYI